MTKYNLHTKFYLAGPISWVKDDSFIKWRDDIEAFLFDIGMEAMNPISKYKDPAKEKKKLEDLIADLDDEITRDYIRQCIINADIDLLTESDAVIAFVPKYSVGTCAEMGIAYLQGKPVYVVTPLQREEMGAWLIGLSTIVFGCFESLKAYLKLMNAKERNR